MTGVLGGQVTGFVEVVLLLDLRFQEKEKSTVTSATRPGWFLFQPN